MGLIDSFLKLMKLNDEDDYDDDDYDDYEEEEPLPPVNNTKKSKKITRMQDYEPEERVRSNNNRVPVKPVVTTRNTTSKKSSSGGTGMEVCVIKPNSVEDAREIAETLLSNRAVVLNVEGLDVGVAQRIIDIAYGSCFAIDGNLQKISNYIFIITPASVDISGDFQEILGDTFSVQGMRG